MFFPHIDDVHSETAIIEANTLISIADFAQVSKLISAADLPEAASATSAPIDYETLFIYLRFGFLPKMWEARIREGSQSDSMVDVISGRE